jgi:hypothetical protein
MKTQKRVKKQANEKLTDATISRVIELLENTEKPISKKEACEILNISYNTTRLNTIITNWKEEKEDTARKKKERRGKPAQPEEIRNIAESLLEGENVASIAKRIYRSPVFVKNVIAKIGIPEKIVGDDKYKTALLPEECIAEEFAAGEIAWSAKYHAPCRVEKELTEPVYIQRYGSKCYRVYITEKMENTSAYFPSVDFGGFFAFVPGYDLGKLDHLEKYGASFKYL